jgi:hypothetical protein
LHDHVGFRARLRGVFEQGKAGFSGQLRAPHNPSGACRENALGLKQ